VEEEEEGREGGGGRIYSVAVTNKFIENAWAEIGYGRGDDDDVRKENGLEGYHETGR
jgi:hypothetical protein